MINNQQHHHYNQSIHHASQRLSVVIIFYQRLCILYKRRRRLTRGILLTLFFLPFLAARLIQIPTPYSRISQRKAPLLDSFPPSFETLQQLNDYLSPLSLQERLNYWIYEQQPQHKVISVTSLGSTGMVLLDVMAQMNVLSLITVVTIDTLHLFPETYQFYDTVQEHYPELDLRVYTPKVPGSATPTRQAFDAYFGGDDLYRTDPEKYAYHSKVEPLQRALDELQAHVWFTGRRRDQGDERSQLKFVEWEESDKEDASERPKRLKVNLMADWTYEQVWSYLHEHDVPYNPLHDRGYKSIGDTMTTRAVASTAAERSGRFVGLNQTECGMHHHLEKLETMRQEAVQQNVAFELPTIDCLECDYELTADTFFDVIEALSNVLLLEFYSPLCGACQDFAPTMEQVVSGAKHGEDWGLNHNIQVARYDITVDQPTPAMEEAGFEVEVTPTLYLVLSKERRPVLYTGQMTSAAILKWIQNQLTE
jgi:phosphoadenosine phosphosulfate reductase